MKIVIIEDDAKNAENLSTTLKEVSSQVEIVAVLPTIKQAIQYFEQPHVYDLIFGNIQLADGLCFDIFKQVSVSKPVIYCAATDKYAMEAFNYNGIAYILNPCSKAAAEKALSKFIMFTQPNSHKQLLADFQLIAGQLKQEEKQVLVHHKDKVIPISTDAVAMFYIEKETTKLLCFNGSAYTLPANLDDLEIQYSSKFFRANRQFLINKKAVKEVSKFFARKLLVHLTISFPQEIIVSKTKATQFFAWLSK